MLLVVGGGGGGAVSSFRMVPLAEAVIGSEDASEGARAFAEKRRPVWRGR
jgi:enoyl-CoA hydratase/carnithine racemase